MICAYASRAGSLQAIADKLNADGILTARGRAVDVDGRLPTSQAMSDVVISKHGKSRQQSFTNSWPRSCITETSWSTIGKLQIQFLF
jgi:hypothetical protein